MIETLGIVLLLAVSVLLVLLPSLATSWWLSRDRDDDRPDE
ncbi:hypothetical protein [Haloterrigena alkaliphila]|nr:hypothetical protein [Haloterrigena alkaliphila]